MMIIRKGHAAGIAASRELIQQRCEAQRAWAQSMQAKGVAPMRGNSELRRTRARNSCPDSFQRDTWPELLARQTYTITVVSA
jgi:hypothetical protein